MTATDTIAGAVISRAAAPAVACRHCGEPVPGAWRAADGDTAFCCGGCAASWTILHEAGLEHYYDLPERRGRAVQPSGRTHEEFDHPAYQALHVRAVAGGLAETEFRLEGVHCPSCVWLVERVPLLMPGVHRAELDVVRAIARIEWDPAAQPLSAVARQLDSLGYTPHPFRGAGADALRRREDRVMLTRIGVAGALAANVMMVAIATYAGWFGHMEAAQERYFRWVSLALVLPAVIWPGRVFFRGAWSALRQSTLSMDVPIALALAAGTLRGAFNTITDSGPIYFDGVATLIFLLLVGRFAQQRAQRAAVDSAELLHALTPMAARVLHAGQVREVPVEALLPGMTIEVRPGDPVAADGVVVEGRSEMDRSLLTGETRPEPVGPGDHVHAGTINGAAPLRVRVEQAGEATRVGSLLREVERAAGRRAPLVQLADRLSGAFVGAVLLLALVTFVVWSRVDTSRALDHAIALLVVTCPCALALATPLTVSVAIGQAARRGILIRGGEALQRMAAPGLLLLDKTGTLTEGRATLVRWEGADGLRPWVIGLEHHSQHPLARAFRAAWPEVAAAEATNVTQTAGGGLAGDVAGRRVVVGTPAHVRSQVTGAPPPEETSQTLVWVAVEGEVVGRAWFDDAVRDDAAAALAALRAQGFRTRILSGDTPGAVARVAAHLGFAADEAQGGLSPEEKLAHVERAVPPGRVVMAGDGVNDAAAMARADVGVGMRGGAEACLTAADVYLARGGVTPLAELAAGSRRTMRVIRRGIAISVVYNLFGAGLAMAGRIDPLVAAVLMPVSSIVVVLLAWRSRMFDGRTA